METIKDEEEAENKKIRITMLSETRCCHKRVNNEFSGMQNCNVVDAMGLLSLWAEWEM